MLNMLGVPSLLTLLQRRLAMWMGHIARMSPDRHPHAALFGVPAGRSFSSGGHHSFVSRAKALLQQLPGVDERTWPVTAQDRQRWSRLVEQLEIAPQVRGVDDDDKYFLFPGRARGSEARATRSAALFAITWLATLRACGGTPLKSMLLVIEFGGAPTAARNLGAKGPSLHTLKLA